MEVVAEFAAAGILALSAFAVRADAFAESGIGVSRAAETPALWRASLAETVSAAIPSTLALLGAPTPSGALAAMAGLGTAPRFSGVWVCEQGVGIGFSGVSAVHRGGGWEEHGGGGAMCPAIERHDGRSV